MQNSEGLTFPEIISSHLGVYAFFTNRLFQQRPSYFINSQFPKATRLYMPVQRHTDTVAKAEEVIDGVIADAVITNRHGLFIGIKTADCVPVLIFDPSKRAIAAVHAGWRGTVQWILSKTIKQMVTHYGSSARELLVAIGPSIGPCCYQIGPDVVKMILEGRDDSCVLKRKDHYYADLQRANAIEAIRLGVKKDNIWYCRDCTCCLPDKYYSYRYNNGQTHRQYGIIGLLDGQ